jgi:hypothetical protein
MKAKLVDSMRPGDRIYEIKFDGYRALALRDGLIPTAGRREPNHRRRGCVSFANLLAAEASSGT